MKQKPLSKIEQNYKMLCDSIIYEKQTKLSWFIFDNFPYYKELMYSKINSKNKFINNRISANNRK